MKRPRGSSAVMAQRQVITAEEIDADPRADLDFMPTPPWGTRSALRYVLRIDAEIGQHLTCWDPCCGEGHMTEPLKEVFGMVYASDVYPHGYGEVGSFVGDDGLGLGDLAQCPFKPDWIIANPPFKLAHSFAIRALEEARRGVALLLRLQWLESEERYDLFSRFEPYCMGAFSERLAMVKYRWDPKAKSATAYAWFVWKCPTWRARGETPEFPTIIIPYGCKERLTKPSDYRLAKPRTPQLIGAQS